MSIDPQILKYVFAVLIALAASMAWRSLRKAQATDGNGYDLLDLLKENGKASKSAHVMMGAFAATTWFFLYYTMTGRMSEGYFGLYAAAWIAPVVAKMVTGTAPKQEGS